MAGAWGWGGVGFACRVVASTIGHEDDHDDLVMGWVWGVWPPWGVLSVLFAAGHGAEGARLLVELLVAELGTSSVALLDKEVART